MEHVAISEAELVDAPGGRHLLTLLGYLGEGRDLPPELYPTIFAQRPFTPSPKRPWNGAERARRELESFEVVGYERVGSRVTLAKLVAPNGRTWRYAVAAADDGQITWDELQSVREGQSLRPVTDADAAALADLESRTPIVLNDISVFFDRGDDYFAAERIMGSIEGYVLEQEGTVVGYQGLAPREAIVHGERIRPAQSHRVRLAPEARGGGAMGALAAEISYYAVNHYDFRYGFTQVDNEVQWRRSMPPSVRWPVLAERVLIDATGASSDTHARVATAADADHIVELLNAAHEREEFYFPYTTESLADRLTRASDLYGWSSILVSPDAVVGVWQNALGVRRIAPDGESSDRRALVLDYGFKPGAEDEFAALIDAACSRAASLGDTELSIFTSAHSPGRELLRSRAKRTEEFGMRARFHEPADAERGLYVDQLFF